MNERLKRLFAEFRIDASDDHYIVLPVLRPDVIEAHADPSGALKVMAPEGDRLVVPPEGVTSASPVVLIVPPPSRAVEVPITGASAWAEQPVIVGFSELRIPR